MFKRLARGFFLAAALLVIVLFVTIGSLLYYFEKHHDQIILDLAHEAGLDVHYRSLALTTWREFPKLEIRSDSLVIRDTLDQPDCPPLLRLETIQASISVANVLSGVLHLDTIYLSHGAIHSERLSNGRFNYGELFTPKEGRENNDEKPWLQLNWQDAHLKINQVHCLHADDRKRKKIDFFIDSLRLNGTETSQENYQLSVQLAADVAGIAFNTQKGAFLRNTRLSGPIRMSVNPDSVIIHPTRLAVGLQFFELGMRIDKKNKEAHFTIWSDSVHYELSRPLLPQAISEKLARYQVTGPFPAVADIYIDPDQPRDPEIHIDFELSGQSVRILQYPFTEVHTKGTMINRLTVAEGGIANSKKNLRISLGKTSGKLDGMNVFTPRAKIAAIANDAILTAPVFLSGPAASLSRQLRNTQFFFQEGQFSLQTEIDASLDDVTQLINSSDGQLFITKTNVRYQPAEMTLPFEHIALKKQGEDIQFNITTQSLPSGLSLHFDGTIDNLAPLLLHLPGDALNSKVNLSAERFDWMDFRTLFGDDGYLADVAAPANSAAQAASMRKTLLGIKQTFNPKIDLSLDTVAYYDVFSFTDFSSGLHFMSDTMVLEKTSFNWAGSSIDFGAELQLSQINASPFSIEASGSHINLNRLRPTLEYFGLRLPKELDTLPQSLNIDYLHQGKLSDATGIMVGFNTGSLHFQDKGTYPVAGEMCFASLPEGFQTSIELFGDPRFLNKLFLAENFFFEAGDFALSANILGMPHKLEDLIRQSHFHLHIENTEVLYRPQQLRLPINDFLANINQGKTTFSLQLGLADHSRPVSVNGTLSDLNGFLAPVARRHYAVNANLSAPVLYWSDVEKLLPVSASGATPPPNATNALDLIGSQHSMLQQYRPELTIAIDSFFVADLLPFTALNARLRFKEDFGFVLDQTGFKLGQGTLMLKADLGTEIPSTPLFLELAGDQLDLSLLLPQLKTLKLPLPEDVSALSGILDLKADFKGQFSRGTQQIDWQNGHGNLHFNLRDLAIDESPFLRQIGKKLKMRKRFERFRSSPIEAQLTLDSGRLSLPRLELQNTAIQLFAQGHLDLQYGPDLLISIPLRNIGRGVKLQPPPFTGFTNAGWKVYLILENDEKGRQKSRFRLGRRRFYKDRGLLEHFRQEQQQLKQLRKANG